MSIFALTFIFCCLCMHACNARDLLLHHHHHHHHHIPSKQTTVKVEETVNVWSDSVKVTAKKAPIVEEARAGLNKKMEKSTENGEILAGVIPHTNPIPTKSLHVSVTHTKRDEHPEFYSDYSRPRTRPPSHN